MAQPGLGGGIDLTPYFPFPKDFKHFHISLKGAVESSVPGHYAQYKNQCDQYFTLPHRKEMRGIGGIFFDYLQEEPEKHFDLVQTVGKVFLPAYLPFVQNRKKETFSELDKFFQLFRRGRYVEFNLIYDRGTLFGLKTEGRAESILMSLPLKVEFPYNWVPEKGSIQEEMTKLYQPRDWC